MHLHHENTSHLSITREETRRPGLKTERPLLFVTGCFRRIQMFSSSQCERGSPGSVYIKECRGAVIITRITASQWCLLKTFLQSLCSVASGSAAHRLKQWKTSGNGLFGPWDNSSLLNPLWGTIRTQIIQEHQSSKTGHLILANNEVRPVFTLQGGYSWHHHAVSVCVLENNWSGTIKHGSWRRDAVLMLPHLSF